MKSIWRVAHTSVLMYAPPAVEGKTFGGIANRLKISGCEASQADRDLLDPQRRLQPHVE
jgi:hypothetical protein